MIRYLYPDDLCLNPQLHDTMFCDRAKQFRDRLSWDVTVDENGHERDEYDDLNPLYVVWECEDGSHGGSMRILPTTGDAMVNDHFLETAGGVRISSPLIWECTRFCLSPRVGPAAGQIASSLMMAGCELGLRFGLSHAVGVFDARMVRIYRSIGWEPEILGSTGEGRSRISVGLWSIEADSRAEISARSGIAEATAAEWFERSFPITDPMAEPIPETAMVA
ncbi:MAG: acyl-homoserine-lactone synthase [Pseudomonadota bacterium]